MRNSIIVIVSVITLTLIGGLNGYSQIYNYGGATYFQLNRANAEISNERVKINLFADSIFATSSVHYFRVENPDKEGEIVFIRKVNGNVRAFQLLIAKTNYFILCSDSVDNPCKCGPEMYIYLPDDRLLKSIEKPFSFSLRRNLVDALNKYAGYNLSSDSFNDRCEVLQMIAEDSR